MKNIVYCFGCFYLIFYLQSCNSATDSPEENTQNERIDSFESALPHGSSLPNIEMSDEDKLKLAKAVGKEAILITIDSLHDIIEQDSSGWCLYNFWNLDCIQCLEINRSLKQIEVADLNVKYVNTVSLYPDQVNAYVRENGIVNEVYSIPTDTLDNWANQIDPMWNGALPAMLLINNKEGTKLFYQQEFSKDELQAILETLSL